MAMETMHMKFLDRGTTLGMTTLLPIKRLGRAEVSARDLLARWEAVIRLRSYFMRQVSAVRIPSV